VGMFAQVQPAALNGPAGVRRSFWDALPLDPTPGGKAVEQPTSRGKGESVEPRYVFGAVACTTVTVISEPRGAIQATSLRDSPSLRFNPSRNQKEKGEKSTCALLTGGAIYGFAGGFRWLGQRNPLCQSTSSPFRGGLFNRNPCDESSTKPRRSGRYLQKTHR
jgi:hypothetical protein